MHLAKLAVTIRLRPGSKRVPKPEDPRALTRRTRRKPGEHTAIDCQDSFQSVCADPTTFVVLSRKFLICMEVMNIGTDHACVLPQVRDCQHWQSDSQVILSISRSNP